MNPIAIEIGSAGALVAACGWLLIRREDGTKLGPLGRLLLLMAAALLVHTVLWWLSRLAVGEDGARAWTGLVLGQLGLVGILVALALELRARVRSGRSTLQSSTDEIRRLSLEDALTGLPNRASFQERVGDAASRAGGADETVAVLLLDLDHFKSINDSFGQKAGDGLIKQVAERLSPCLREADSIARLGGDEFGILMPQIQGMEECAATARQIVDRLNEPFFQDNREIRTGASLGISVLAPGVAAPDQSGGDQLLRDAELALYRAKEEGRGVFRIYDAAMDRRVRGRRALEEDFRHALERGELHLVYQPKLSIVTGEVTGAEALLRWEHPERGLVSPSEFIPVAEATHLIVPITEWILETVCQQNRSWQDSGLPAFSASVNLSPVHFKQERLVDRVRAIVLESGLHPRWLEIELTETTAMEGGAESLDKVNRLRSLGIRIAIDDFGTGFSSLNRLRQIPVDRLKIDRSFIHNVAENRDDAAIVSAVIRLGHAMNIAVIAEGVETAEQLAFLIEQDCDEIQGFYFGKPMSPSKFCDFVRSHDAAAFRQNLPNRQTLLVGDTLGAHIPNNLLNS